MDFYEGMMMIICFVGGLLLLYAFSVLKIRVIEKKYEKSKKEVKRKREEQMAINKDKIRK